MFKAAKAGQKKAITANRLDDGRVVFLDDVGGWAPTLVEAKLLSDGPELDQATAYAKAQHDARVVVEPYAIEVVTVDGIPVPARIRERIRAQGPTVRYGEAEYAALSSTRLAEAAE
jgi:hypothetical protein